MDLRKVKKLIELLESSAVVEMEITEGENTIRLSRASAVGMPMPSHPVNTQNMTDQATVGQVGVSRDEIVPLPIEQGDEVKSPMVGTFYVSSSPDSEPYVTLGSVVQVGDVLCIIEAMKTFNQLDADVAGTVKAIYKSHGDPVEFGEPLFLIG